MIYMFNTENTQALKDISFYECSGQFFTNITVNVISHFEEERRRRRKHYFQTLLAMILLKKGAQNYKFYQKLFDNGKYSDSRMSIKNTLKL